MNAEAEANRIAEMRMELKYCERCGALQIQPRGQAQPSCTRCVATLAWLGEGRR